MFFVLVRFGSSEPLFGVVRRVREVWFRVGLIFGGFSSAFLANAACVFSSLLPASLGLDAADDGSPRRAVAELENGISPSFFSFFFLGEVAIGDDRVLCCACVCSAPVGFRSVRRRFDFPGGFTGFGGFRGAFLRFCPASSSGRPSGSSPPPPPCVSQLAAARALAVRAPESGHFAEFFLSYPRICSRLCPAAPHFGGFRR